MWKVGVRVLAVVAEGPRQARGGVWKDPQGPGLELETAVQTHDQLNTGAAHRTRHSLQTRTAAPLLCGGSTQAGAPRLATKHPECPGPAEATLQQKEQGLRGGLQGLHGKRSRRFWNSL